MKYSNIKVEAVRLGFDYTHTSAQMHDGLTDLLWIYLFTAIGTESAFFIKATGSSYIVESWTRNGKDKDLVDVEMTEDDLIAELHRYAKKYGSPCKFCYFNDTCCEFKCDNCNFPCWREGYCSRYRLAP